MKATQAKQKVDLKSMARRWPSALVARNEIDKFTGGVIHPRTMANKDAFGEGIENSFRVGRKVVYHVADVIRWLEKHAEAVE